MTDVYGLTPPICMHAATVRRLARNRDLSADQFIMLFHRVSAEEIAFYGVQEIPLSDCELYCLRCDAKVFMNREAYISDAAFSGIWRDFGDTEIPAKRLEFLRRIWDEVHHYSNA